MRIEGCGSRVQKLRFTVEEFTFRDCLEGCRVVGLVLRVHSRLSGLRVSIAGFGVRVWVLWTTQFHFISSAFAHLDLF